LGAEDGTPLADATSVIFSISFDGPVRYELFAAANFRGKIL